MFQIVDVPLEAPRKLFPPAKRRVLPFSKLPFDQATRGCYLVAVSALHTPDRRRHHLAVEGRG